LVGRSLLPGAEARSGLKSTVLTLDPHSPQSAFHGLRSYELDPSGWLILGLAKVGLAWDVIGVTPEKARAKSLAGAEV
jgi:hypothetical protein